MSKNTRLKTELHACMRKWRKEKPPLGLLLAAPMLMQTRQNKCTVWGCRHVLNEKTLDHINSSDPPIPIGESVSYGPHECQGIPGGGAVRSGDGPRR